jgi:ketosteroid isomerase-like protein
MSAENVEASRQLWGRFLAGDTEAVLDRLDEDIVVHEPPELPGAGVYHGHAGWLEQLAKFREAIGDIEYSVLEHIDCGDHVVTVVEASGVGASSGVPGSVTYAEVETWRGGKIISIRYFMSTEAALGRARTL